MPNGAKALGASAQSTVELVRNPVMFGVALKTGRKLPRSFVRTNINLEHTDLVTSDDAVVNGKADYGASVHKRAERVREDVTLDVFTRWSTKETCFVIGRGGQQKCSLVTKGHVFPRCTAGRFLAGVGVLPCVGTGESSGILGASTHR